MARQSNVGGYSQSVSTGTGFPPPSAGGMVNNDKMHTAILTFSKSLAGYSVATFVLVSKTHQSSGGRTRLT